MIHAIVPAAGQSSRMGRPKLLLPLGERTVVERVVAALREAGVGQVVVVVAPRQGELAARAAAAGAQVVTLAAPTPEMRATVLAGLNWLEHHGPPEAWLLVPADHPTLEAAVVRQLIQAREETACSIVVPSYQGRRGHPVLIDWRHVAGIRQLPEGAGINAYLRQQAAATRELPVDSPAILFDLDTPEDYERLLKGERGAAAPGG